MVAFAESTRAALEQPQTRDIHVLKGIRALVVDDNAVNRRILKATLDRWGLLCTIAEDGEKALRELSDAISRHAPYSLIVTDLSMPGMDGYEFVGQVRKIIEYTSAAILIMSSSGNQINSLRDKSLNIAAHLTKPLRHSELQQALFDCATSPRPGALRMLQKAAALPPPKPSKPLHILLAEDNPINQRLAQRLVEKRGHEISFASTGEEALNLFADNRYDLILMDIQMPDMDGLETTAAIRKIESRDGRARILIVALTAHAMKGDREKCLAAGMDRYLTKPLRSAELYELLDQMSWAKDEAATEGRQSVLAK
jgi:CheY-like chemotaxis protein